MAESPVSSNVFIGFLSGAALGVPVAEIFGASVPLSMILVALLGAFLGRSVDEVKNG